MGSPKKNEIAQRLRVLAETAADIASEIDYYGGLAEWAIHGRELANASLILKAWVMEIENDDTDY